MLSKEENKLTIEELLKAYNDLKNNTSLVESISVKPFIEFVDLLLSKIQELETREQKLIDKLEEDIEKFNRKENVFMTQSSQINASLISYINEILSIVR